jgi:hypothetical protein
MNAPSKTITQAQTDVFSNISYHPLFYLLKEPVTGQRQLIMKEIFIWRVA